MKPLTQKEQILNNTPATTITKTEMVTFRSTPVLRQLLDKICDTKRVSRSEYLRELIENAHTSGA